MKTNRKEESGEILQVMSNILQFLSDESLSFDDEKDENASFDGEERSALVHSGVEEPAVVPTGAAAIPPKIDRNQKSQRGLSLSALQLHGPVTMVILLLLFSVASIVRRCPLHHIPMSVISTTTPPPAANISYLSFDHHSRPSLDELIGDEELDIRGDVQWLLDFAIIAHSKCATTSIQRWLRSHPQIQMYDHEVGSLMHNRPAELVEMMYNLTKENALRGYKAPNDIRYDYALAALHTYFPKTKLIIGVRHPVRWFESYYNYNKRLGYREKELLPAEEMTGDSIHAKFHVHLSKLGKTNVLDPEELKLLGDEENNHVQPVRMTNPVFMYEVSQPFDAREGRDVQFRKDMQEFLGLTTPMDPIKIRTRSSKNYHYAIDICEEKYRALRQELIEGSKIAATWIINYFLTQPDVTVSSPEHFKELLQGWSNDPCDN